MEDKPIILEPQEIALIESLRRERMLEYQLRKEREQRPVEAVPIAPEKPRIARVEKKEAAL